MLKNQKEYDKKRYIDNREEIIKKVKEYRTNNKEQIKITKAKQRAKLLKLDFNINISDIVIPKICPVLGISLKGETPDNCPSLDRIDNTKGYIKGNVCIISHRANRLKSDATLEELEKIINYIKKGRELR